MPQPAKLSHPRLHRVLPRGRLFARLDACRTFPLILVAGPPGADKTALAASWLDAAHRRHMVPRGTRKHAPLPTFIAAHQMDPAGFARLYFRALFERLKAPAVLVFDN